MALFLGGPWHGQHHPTNNAPRIVVPLIEDEAFDLLVANGSSDDPPTVVALIAKLREAETVIAAALNHDPLHGRTEGLHCGGMAPCVRDVLATYKPTNQEGSAS